MRAESTKTGAIWVLKVGLGGLLLYAGVLKLQEPSAFAEQIANYRFLPALAPLLAATLPVVELVVGSALILAGRKSGWLPAAALGSALLMAVFAVAVIQVVLRGIDTTCGCFGAGSSTVDWLTVARVLGLGALSTLLFRLTYIPTDAQSKAPSTTASEVS